MSHTVDCVIDTTEMARSVDTVNKHIDGTTGAVVAMKLAVVAAEKEGADHVCNKVNKGFYSLIHSQISQKMAKLQSEVEAKLMRLTQQRKQLNGIRRRMERDYQMICSRYGKTFTAINRNLKQRITEIDRPIVDFVSTDAEKVTNRSNQLISTVPVGQNESVKYSQRIITSNLKRKAFETITSIRKFIEASNRLKQMTDMIMLPQRINENVESVMVPVALMDSNYDSSGNIITRTYVSEMPMSKESVTNIENRVNNAVVQNEMTWVKEDSISSETMNAFRKMVNDSGLDSRRQEMILKMFESNPYEILSNK